MPLYLATPLYQNAKEALIATVINQIDEHDRYQIKNGGWLIKFSGTSRELSEKLGVTGPQGATSVGSVLIVSINGYYGRGPTDMWEWIKTRME